MYSSSKSDNAKLKSLLKAFHRLKDTLSANLTLSVTITSVDESAWGEMYQSWLFTLCRVVLTIFAVVCCYFATRRFFLYWYWPQKKAILPLFCLFIEAITNLLRAVYTAVDPFWSQNIMSFQVSRILAFITVPWSLSTSLMIGLFWAQLLTELTTINAGRLSRFKLHFIVLLVLFILLELLSSMVHAFKPTFIRIPIILFTTLMGVGMQVVVALLFLVHGYRVLRIITRGSVLLRTNKRRASQLRKMTLRLVGSGVGMLLFAFCVAYAGSRVFSPYVYLFSFYGIYLGLQITSIFQIFAFADPRSVVPELSISLSDTTGSTAKPLSNKEVKGAMSKNSESLSDTNTTTAAATHTPLSKEFKSAVPPVSS